MSTCEEYGALISAMIDDELSADERSTIDAHLQSCRACRRRAERFTELDRLATIDAPIPPLDWQSDIQRRVHVRRQRQRVSWAATYLAAAAVLILMVGTVMHFRDRNFPAAASSHPAEVASRKQDATPTPKNDVIGPLQTLQIVSRQEQRTHASMRKLMEWDLRALKLELKQMDLSPEQAAQLGRRIDRLIERVGEAGHNSDAPEIGESI